METIRLVQKKGYAIVQLNRPKVNAINHQMVEELRTTFKSLQENESIGGAILTGTPHFFSAGLDVIELYNYDEIKIRAFLIDFARLHIELVRFTKPLICALNGHSPAGGTVLAIAADNRIMAEGEKYTLGLNEVAVNIQISQMLVESYAFWIGKGLAHRYIMEGKLLNGKEALACGLIDEIVPADRLLERAEQKMQKYLGAHPDILRNTKLKLRKTWLEIVDKNSAEDLEQALSVWWKPEVRTRMKMFVDSLSKKK